MLRFACQYNITQDENDLGIVKISIDNGEQWETVKQIKGTRSYWDEIEINLTYYREQSIIIGFEFITHGSSSSKGWYIDNIFVEDRDLQLYTETFTDYESEQAWHQWNIVQKENCPDIWVDDYCNSASPGWQKSHFNKIQDALNHSEDNFFIKVMDGYYYERLEIEKSVILEGNSSTDTIIDGGIEYYPDPDIAYLHIYINASNVVFSDFHLCHGGLYVSGEQVQVNNCIFSENEFAISFFYTNKGSLLNCIFSKDTYETNQRITIYNSNNILIKNNILYDSDVGIHCYGSTINHIVSNEIYNATYSISFYSANFNHVENNLIQSNQDSDYGMNVYSCQQNTITKNRIYNCKNGINLIKTSFCSIYRNDIRECYDHSIKIIASFGDLISYNNLCGAHSGFEIHSLFSIEFAPQNWWGSKQGARHKTKEILSIVITLFPKDEPVDIA